MALQLSGGAKSVLTGRCHPTSWHPDLDWLQDALSAPQPPRMVVITNPCNPTGVIMFRHPLSISDAHRLFHLPAITGPRLTGRLCVAPKDASFCSASMGLLIFVLLYHEKAKVSHLPSYSTFQMSILLAVSSLFPWRMACQLIHPQSAAHVLNGACSHPGDLRLNGCILHLPSLVRLHVAFHLHQKIAIERSACVRLLERAWIPSLNEFLPFLSAAVLLRHIAEHLNCNLLWACSGVTA